MHIRPDVLQHALEFKPTQERNHSHKPHLIGLKGGKCAVCGYAYTGTNKHHFDFHHRDPMAKSFCLGTCRRGLEALLEEAEKCDLLCLFCHADYHCDEDRPYYGKRAKNRCQ